MSQANYHIFGKYILLERLASGGMAEVYLAKRPGADGIGTFVALKRILPQYSDKPEYVGMFKEEAKIAVNLKHNNVVTIHDFGIHHNHFFLVMDYVEGRNLRQILNDLKKNSLSLSIEQIIYIIKEVASGLDYAHRCMDGKTGRPLHITHRDISPQNVMISFEGEVKVIDFGIAKAETNLENTKAGTIKGKFSYMSPEQAEGNTVDLRTDIFSLGIVLWELLANDRLFLSNNELNTINKIKTAHIPSLRKLNPQISPELERICLKALSKDRNMRYQTSAAFHRDLNRFLNTQYPDFSNQDFSVFMKSVYADTIISNRKRLIEYSKVGETWSDTDFEKTETYTGSQNPVNNDENTNHPEGFDASATNNKQLDIPSFEPLHQTSTNHRHTQTMSSGTFDSINTTTWNRTKKKKRRKRKNQQDNLVTGVIAAIAISAAAFLIAPPIIKAIFSNETGRIESASTVKNRVLTGKGNQIVEKIPVTISTFPSGARINLNGRFTGLFSPAQLHLPKNNHQKVTFSKDGYVDYETTIVVSKPESKSYTLQRSQFGYVDLELVNGGANPRVIINGLEVREKTPITKYPIPANTVVDIRVENPYRGLSAATKVKVGLNTRQRVRLVLRKKKSKK